MKLTSNWGELGTSRQPLRGPTTSPAETAVFATLGVAGMVAVVIAAVSGSRPAKLTDQTLADLRASPVGWHVPYEQIVTDIRVVAATPHDLLRTERPMVTNLIESAST